MTNIIDVKMLPKVIISWSNKQGNFYLDCQTNQIANIKPNLPMGIRWASRDNDTIMVKRGSKVYYAYAKYHSKEDLLELACATINTNSGGEHEWEYAGDRFFLNHNKEILDINGRILYRGGYSSPKLYRWHCPYSEKSLLSEWVRINFYKTYSVNEFKKFIGDDSFTISNGRVIYIQYPWHMQEWYKTSQKVRGKGKTSKLIDCLTSLPLSNIDTSKYPTRVTDGWTNQNSFLYFEKVDDDWDVMRHFMRINDRDIEAKEDWRFYISTNKVQMASYTKNGWIPGKVVRDYWNRSYIANPEEAYKCERIKYISKAFDKCLDSNDYDIQLQIINILKFSDIEQLFKLGYEDRALDLAKSNTPKADIKNMFGSMYNDKGKSLLKKVDMTKSQFDAYMKEYSTDTYYAVRGLKLIREMHNGDTTCLDDVTFTNELRCLTELSHNIWGRNNSLDSLLSLFPSDIDIKKLIRSLIKISKTHENGYRIFSDFLSSYNELNNPKPEINWYFDCYSDLVRIHDSIDELRRQQKEERRAKWDKELAECKKKEEEHRQKIDKQRKQYEYYEDDYMIRLPQDDNEIIREDSMQRICIGSYVSRHSIGDTNLYFLRKTSEPGIPLYAIEVNNSNYVVQIHGYGNAWLGCKPELIPTVIRWLRKNNFKCDQKILTCTAHGYGSNNEYCEMPIVDGKQGI